MKKSKFYVFVDECAFTPPYFAILTLAKSLKICENCIRGLLLFRFR